MEEELNLNNEEEFEDSKNKRPKKREWSSFKSIPDLIKYLYASDPRNWSKSLAEICKENNLSYNTINSAIDRYGWDRFKKELQEMRQEYIKNTLETVGNLVLNSTKLALQHIYEELEKGGSGKWKAMWHLREFIKSMSNDPYAKDLLSNQTKKLTYEKVIISLEEENDKILEAEVLNNEENQENSDENKDYLSENDSEDD